MRFVLVVFAEIAAVVALAIAVPTAAVATGGEGEAWPTFNESSACGAVFTRTPYVEQPGGIPVDEILRGPYGAMFGRTVAQVRANITTWRIPGSTRAMAVHERAIPALELVAAELEAAMALGERYVIDSSQTSSLAARTIGGRSRLSRHTFGIAMDLNSRRNPFRDDNQLITDFPDWWVDAFAASGFCWGGQWIGSKDAMHFAWQGPAFTPGGELPPGFAPLTESVPLDAKALVTRVVPRPLDGTFGTLLADGDGSGAVDVINLSRLGADLVVDASVATRTHNACSLRRSVVIDAPDPVAFGFGDWDGRGGHDLWLVTEDEGFLRLTVRYRYGDYSAETAVTTRIPMPDGAAWLSTADADRDGALDLVVVGDNGIRIWDVDPWTGAALLQLGGGSAVTTGTLMLGDADGDELPDLWSLEDGTVTVAAAADRFATVAHRHEPAGVPGTIVDAAASDFDGDGRTDLVVYDGRYKHVWLGNTPLPDGLPLAIWFTAEEPQCGDDEPRWEEIGIRRGTGGFVTRGAFAWLERSGFPYEGCDPTNEDIMCPPRPVSAGELAASMAWMLDLDPGAGTGFDAAGRALRDAGYESPCTPGDGACWEREVPRAEVSVRFWTMLEQRDGRAPEPHRWVWPEA